jgi:hypothetical protein
MMRKSRAFGRLVALVLSVVVGLSAWGLARVPQAHAEGTFLSIGMGTNDLCYDDARGLLYMTNGPYIMRYDVTHDRWIEAVLVGGGLTGIDLSPDGRTIAVCDDFNDVDGVGDGTNHIFLVDADTGVRRVVKFAPGVGGTEAGTRAVAYGYDGRLLVTAGLGGSGGTVLRRYDPLTGIVTEAAVVPNYVDLSASGDRTLITYAQSSISYGGWGTYRVLDGYVNHRDNANGTSSSNYGAATNRDGTQSTILAGSTAYVYDNADATRRTVGGVVGAEYSPTADVVYMPVNGQTTIKAYDTRTLSLIKTFDFEGVFGYAMGGVGGVPRLAVSRDNTLLFATVPGGVRFSRISPAVTGTVRSTFRGAPVPTAFVELWRQTSGTWSIEATTPANSGGSWTYHTTNTATPLRARVVDASGINAPKWFGGTDINTATDLTPSNVIVPSADVTLTVVAPGSITGTVRSTWKSQPIDGAQVVLYHEAEHLSSIATATTDADGNYTFAGLGASSFRVGLSDPSGDHTSEYYNDKPTLGGATSIALTSPEPHAINATLAFVSFRVSGTVKSTFHNMPVAGALVEVWRDNGHGFTIDTTLTAGADGAWQYESDTGATVHIRALDPSGASDPLWLGGASTVSDSTDVVPIRGGTPPHVALTMPLAHPATIVGTLRSSWEYQPIPNAVVALYYNDGTGLHSIAATRTAANGSYSFAGLGSATLYVGFTDPSGAHLANAYTATPIVTTYDGLEINDVTLTRIPSGIGGTVVSSFDGPDADNPNPPIQSALVEIYRKNGASWTLETTLTAGTDGSWMYSALDPTETRIRVTDPTGMHDAAWFGGTVLENADSVLPVPISLEIPPTDVVLELAHPAIFHGTVRDSVSGVRLPWISVALVGSTGDYPLVAWADTAADGTYSMPGVPAGSYYVVFMDSDWRYEDQIFDGATTVASATVVAPRAPGEYECNARMKPIVVRGYFEPIEITAGSAQPLLGQGVRLATWLTGDEWGGLISDAKVVIQTSADMTTWATDFSTLVTLTPDGSYETTVVPSNAGTTTFYRFVVMPDEFHAACNSDPIAITPRTGPIYFGDLEPAGPDGWLPKIGMPTGMRATLRDSSGVVYPGKTLRLLTSADGRTYAESGVNVTNRGDGSYQADFGVARTVWCKFRWDSPTGPVYSAPAMITPHVDLGAWFEWSGLGATGAEKVSLRSFTPVWVVARLRTNSVVAKPGKFSLETTYDGLTWSKVNPGAGTAITPAQSAQSPGLFTTFNGAGVNRSLRLAWMSNDWSQAAASRTLTYQAWIYAGRPSVGSKQKVGTTFAVTGKSTSSKVLLQLQRKRGSTWYHVRLYSAKNPRPGQSFSYRIKLRPARGTYRIRATNAADQTHVQSPPSTWANITVK